MKKQDKIPVRSPEAAVRQSRSELNRLSRSIALQGYVTFTQLQTPGQTSISGENITTGSIRADRIQAGVLRSMDEKSIVIDLERGRADITGSFNVSGENEKGYLIGSLRPGSLELVQTDGQGRLLLQLALTEQGVTLSGGGRQLALTLSPEGGRLTGLADPAAEDEAVSKGYLQGYVFAQLDALRAELGLPVG